VKKESVKQLQWIKRNIKVLSMCGNAIYLTASAILGIALTMKSVELARSIRGYVAVGGEWFVLLIVLLVSDLIKKFVVFFIKIIKQVRADDGELAKIVELQSYRMKRRR
jgi:hypothetical protein